MKRLTHKYVDGQAWVSLNSVAKMGENECVGEPITRLARYEDMHDKIEKQIIDIKSSSDYPHNFKGQMVDDFEWVLSLLN